MTQRFLEADPGIVYKVTVMTVSTSPNIGSVCMEENTERKVNNKTLTSLLIYRTL